MKNFTLNAFSCFHHLDKSDLALANIAVGVSDWDLPIVLDPALTTKDVVDAGCHFVPLIVIPKSKVTNTTILLQLPLLDSFCTQMSTYRFAAIFYFYIYCMWQNGCHNLFLWYFQRLSTLLYTFILRSQL